MLMVGYGGTPINWKIDHNQEILLHFANYATVYTKTPDDGCLRPKYVVKEEKQKWK